MNSKNFTFCISCSFDLAVTFFRNELQQEPDGFEGDLEPTDAAMMSIEQRLTELIGKDFELISRARAYTDSDMLLKAQQ